MPAAPDNPTYDHVWHSRSLMTHRVGQKLRILAIGALNSTLVEFEDGHQCVTSRFGYRCIRTLLAGTPCSPGEGCCSFGTANSTWLKNEQEAAKACTTERTPGGFQFVEPVSITKD